MSPADPSPLDPTSEQARRWLEHELSKGTYHASPSLWDRFMDWLDSLFQKAGAGPGLPSWLVPVVVLVVVAVIGLILWRVLRREPSRVLEDEWGAVLDDESISAADLRSRARDHLAAGRTEAAVLDGYRALVVAAIERTILDDLPGRTAREAAEALAPVFPAEHAALVAAAHLFDDVRYGQGTATVDDARQVLLLDERLQAARPMFAEAVPT